MEGHVVFTYSIGNFPTLRCLEQLAQRHLLSLRQCEGRERGGGFSYGQLGMSHHATEDLSILRALPGMVVCAPGTALEARHATDAVIARDGPAYLRLERAAADFTDDPANPFVFGRARTLREGKDITLIGVGGVVAEVVAAAEALAADEIGCRVLRHARRSRSTKPPCWLRRRNGRHRHDRRELHSRRAGRRGGRSLPGARRSAEAFPPDRHPGFLRECRRRPGLSSREGRARSRLDRPIRARTARPMKRLFDFLVALCALLVLSPFLLLISLAHLPAGFPLAVLHRAACWTRRQALPGW